MSKDPLANALSTIKNHEIVRETGVIIDTTSNLIADVFEVMKEEGYIGEINRIDDNKGGRFELKLVGNINDCGVIKPRFSVDHGEFEKWEKRYLPAAGFGILAVSTPEGVISHREAKEEGIGGKLLAFIY